MGPAPTVAHNTEWPDLLVQIANRLEAPFLCLYATESPSCSICSLSLDAQLRVEVLIVLLAVLPPGVLHRASRNVVCHSRLQWRICRALTQVRLCCSMPTLYMVPTDMYSARCPAPPHLTGCHRGTRWKRQCPLCGARSAHQPTISRWMYLGLRY